MGFWPRSASRTKLSIKSLLFSICFCEMPIPCSCARSLPHDGSTFSLVNPFSESKPMWATCEKADGAEMSDLSIGPPFLDFFLPFGEPPSEGMAGALNDGALKEGNLELLFPAPPDERPFLAAIVLRFWTFLLRSDASLSSANAMPIMQSSPGNE